MNNIYRLRKVFLSEDGMMATTENFGDELTPTQVVHTSNVLLRNAYVERQHIAQEYLDIPVETLLVRQSAHLANELDDEDHPLTDDEINNRLNDFVQQETNIRREYAELVATPYVEIDLDTILTRYGPIPDVVSDAYENNSDDEPMPRSAYEVNPDGTMTQAAIEQLTYNYHRFGITLLVVPDN
jgi:hypothetical protein